MSRLPPQSINIPSSYGKGILDEVLEVILELGFDPAKVAGVRLVPHLVEKFRTGGYTRDEFKDSLRKIGILNRWC